MLTTAVAAFGLLSLVAPVLGRPAQEQGDATHDNSPRIFQAAGPTVSSVQASVDGFRDALGGGNNGIAMGPLDSGRREINWDGGGTTDTTNSPTPLTQFLARGALFTTPGSGFVQATTAGLAKTFENPTYETSFQPFSPARLFSAVGSNITEVDFSVPGFPDERATTTGFGSIFSDVDRPNGVPGAPGLNRRSTLVECFGADGTLLSRNVVPASPGDGGLSFFAIKFDKPIIARVRITSGDVAPGPTEHGNGKVDVVMMDDFLYGEPQPLSTR